MIEGPIQVGLLIGDMRIGERGLHWVIDSMNIDRE